MESIKISYFMDIYKDIIIYMCLSIVNYLKKKQKQCLWGFIRYVEVKHTKEERR